MFKSRQALLLGIITLLAPLGSAAQAQDNGLGYAYLFGYGAANTPAIRSFVPAPPYFALHPPVYYGKRYTRPYGDSPFASWPQLRSAASYQPQPAANYVAPVICNLPNYVPGQMPSQQAPQLQGTPAAPLAPAAPSPVVYGVPAVEPLVIDNPYFQPSTAARLVVKPEVN